MAYTITPLLLTLLLSTTQQGSRFLTAQTEPLVVVRSRGRADAADAAALRHCHPLIFFWMRIKTNKPPPAQHFYSNRRWTPQ